MTEQLPGCNVVEKTGERLRSGRCGALVGGHMIPTGKGPRWDDGSKEASMQVCHRHGLVLESEGWHFRPVQYVVQEDPV